MAAARSKNNGNSSSLGNHFKLNQQINNRSFNKTLNTGKSFSVENSLENLNSNTIMQDLTSKFNNCCSIGTDSDGCCLLQYFKENKASDSLIGVKCQSYDWNGITDLIQAARSLLLRKTRDEKHIFIQKMFEESIEENVVNKIGDIVFKMNYKLHGNLKVYKKIFAFVYGISVYNLELCSNAIKQNSTLNLFKLRKFYDDHIHDYNLFETEHIFKSNLGFCGLLFLIVFN